MNSVSIIRTGFCWAPAVFAFAFAMQVCASVPDHATLNKVAKLAVPFVPNAGQWDARAAFAAQTFAGTLFVTKQGELVYGLPGKIIVGADPNAQISRDVGVNLGALGRSSQSDRRWSPATRTRGWVLTETLVDANGQPRTMSQSTLQAPAGYRPMEGKVSYAIGSDTSKHADNLNTYERVNLGDMYPGVNVQLRAVNTKAGNNVEKIFTVAPKHDPKQINIKLAGADKLEIGSKGELIAHTGNGPVTFTAPIAFQETASGERISVQVAYALASVNPGALDSTQQSGTRLSLTTAPVEASPDGRPIADAHRYGFTLGHYDASLPLVIDPLLQSTYQGGSGVEVARTIRIHPTTGEVYIAGYTSFNDLPGTSGGAQTSSGGGVDAFVTRFDAALTTRLQSTYLGGADSDEASALAIHPTSGEVYIVGLTYSTDLPGTGSSAQIALGGSADAFITRFNAALTTRLQSSYLGGTNFDEGTALAIHPTSGDIYVAGYTDSTNLPGALGGAQNALGGGIADAFVSRFNAALTTRVQSTYLGGSASDIAYALAIHPSNGDVYVAGETASANLPSANGGAQGSSGGSSDAFITRFNAALTARVQSTYMGGSNFDDARALAIHPTSGDVYVAGKTTSASLPGVSGGSQSVYGGGGFDAFVTRFNAALTTRVQSSYLGGTGSDIALALAIHPSSEEIYVAGESQSTNLPGVGGAAQNASGGGIDAFVARLNAALTTRLQSSYLGGSASDSAKALAISPTTGEVYVAGETASTNLPGENGGAQSEPGGDFDAFVTRFSYDLGATVPACTLDIDASGGAPNAATDGLMLIRAMFGLPDAAIANGAISAAAPRNTWSAARHHLNNSCGTNFAPVIRPAFTGTACDLDLDGSAGAPDAASDGLMLVRAMLGFTGTAVTDGAITGTPPRNSWTQIRQYLNDNCGTNFTP